LKSVVKLGVFASGERSSQRKYLGWEKVLDDASGAFYFFKVSTGESSWEMPQELLDAGVSEIPLTPRTESRAVALGILPSQPLQSRSKQ
jgi:hypothetical protein